MSEQEEEDDKTEVSDPDSPPYAPVKKKKSKKLLKKRKIESSDEDFTSSEEEEDQRDARAGRNSELDCVQKDPEGGFMLCSQRSLRRRFQNSFRAARISVGFMLLLCPRSIR